MSSDCDVLVVEDQREMVSLLREHLGEVGFRVRTVMDGHSAIEAVSEGFKGVIVLDLQLPDMNGLDVFTRLRGIAPANPVIVLSAFASFGQVSEAVRLGAFDFISKNDSIFAMLPDAIRRAWNSAMGAESKGQKDEVMDKFPMVIGDSIPMRRVMELVNQVVGTRVTVLLEGESGTGKEVIANAIHRMSDRSAGPFVAINCAGIPASLLESELFGHERGAFTGAVGRKIGKFEQANGGTVFLDEIGELDLAVQSKLLRVLQEREVVRIGGTEAIKLNVRILSATNRNLAEQVEENRFRADLFYRLAVFRIHMPPLRERISDLSSLAEFFLERYARQEGLSAPPRLTQPALSLLEEYSFPGNVRELENILTYGAVVCRDRQIGIYDLPQIIQPEEWKGNENRPESGQPSVEAFGVDRKRPEALEALDSLVDRYLRHAVNVCDGNVSLAARHLQVARQTLYRRLPDLKE